MPSDKHLQGCSFQTSTGAHAFETVEDLRALWQAQRQLKEAVLIGGCARLPQRGLVGGLVEGKQSAIIDLASIL